MRANIVSNPNLMAANGRRRRHTGTRTIVVAPNRRRRRRAANPTLARANSPVLMMNAPRRRRRNAAPLIMPMANGRRRRRNGGMGKFNLSNMLNSALVGGLSAGGAYLLNKMFISGLLATGETATSVPTLGGLGMRGAARVVAGALGIALLPGTYGTAFMAANMYPLMAELDQYMHGTAGGQMSPTHDYEADISQALGY
jgi:hypothetical protein